MVGILASQHRVFEPQERRTSSTISQQQALSEMKSAHPTLIGLLCLAVLPGHATQSPTKFSLIEEKGSGKQQGKKQIPTFVGSDGIVRRVSPGAILEEMKRCLPPGLPIPLATAWPELPPHLERLQEGNESTGESHGTLYEGFQNIDRPEDMQRMSQEKKRVSRSNDKSPGGNGVDVPNDQSMNVKLEGPTKQPAIFSAKGLDQNRMAQVFKDVISRQMRKQNLTAEYVDDFVQPRTHKSKRDDYDDYDYIDPEESKPVRAKTNQGRRHSANTFQASTKQRKSRRRNRWRQSQRRRQVRKKPDYDYEYEGSNEDAENHEQHKKVDSQTGRPQSEDQIQRDELEKQIELNDFFEKNLQCNEDGIPERMENIDKFVKRAHFKTRSGENMDVLEGYQKMLAVVMKLNTTLIRLLDKLSAMFQKGPMKNHQEGEDDASKSSVVWDFMDLLMQQRRSARTKRAVGPDVPDNPEVTAAPVPASDGTPPVVVQSSTRTSMDLLKWLLKWYFTCTPA